MRKAHSEGAPTSHRLLVVLAGAKIITFIRPEEWSSVPELLRSGVRGYLLNVCVPAQLLNAIEIVRRGEIFFSPPVAALIKTMDPEDQNAIQSKLLALSNSERRVVELVASDLMSKEIAERLHIAKRTVDKHRASAMHKLHVKTSTQLVKFAIRTGLTGLQ